MNFSERKKQYHVHISAEECAEYVILPGDPGRVEEIARRLESPYFVSRNREYTVWNGFLEGELVTVCSTGIGGPSAAIALHELAACGAFAFIRVGTCGGMQTSIVGGDLIVANGAIRGDGTSVEYMPVEFPAVPHPDALIALIESAKKISSDKEGEAYHVGVVQSKDSFYSQHSPEKMPVAEYLRNRWEAYIRGGTLASEMECATLFIVGQSLNVRVGAVLTAVWNQERQRLGMSNPEWNDNSRGITVAVEAIRTLILTQNSKHIKTE